MIEKEYADRYIEVHCEDDENFKKNIEALDEYDFGPCLTHGRRLESAKESIEKMYDNKFFDKYGFYMFDNLSAEEVQYYLVSRYDIIIQEYTDYIIRHEAGHYETARKRV